ncbi:MAG TPA: ABC transporter permease subunit [Methanocella sp.]|nr:ABC transporter permease subunit [Methanocella sp.]
MAITSKEIQTIQIIAIKEFRDNLLSKRFLIIGIVYFFIALLLAAVVMLSYFSYIEYVHNPNSTDLAKTQSQAQLDNFKPSQVIDYIGILNIVLVLLTVIVSADTLSNEFKDRTIYQLMSKPIDRSSIIMGKYLGCLGVVSSLFVGSALLAYLIVAVATWHIPSIWDFLAVIEAIISTVLIMAVYVAIGVLASSLTKNPYLSIIGSLLAWIGLWFASAIGNMIGGLSQMGQFIVGTDTFNTYPIYAKVLVWIDPLSHGIMEQILHPENGTAAAGMPIWANLIFLLVYAVVLLIIALLAFDYRDISV